MRTAHKSKTGDKISSDNIENILRPIAEALDYAHKQGVIHRDVKPSNIFIKIKNNRVEDAELIDFGLATAIRESLTRVSQMKFSTSGTRPYMPPEQWRGGKQDAQTDQYSLAVVAYELYTGNLPFSGSDVEMLRLAVLNDSPNWINELPNFVNEALQKALSKDREDRFKNCAMLVRALTGKEKASSEQKSSPIKRRTILWVILLAIVGIITAGWMLKGRFSEPKITAEAEKTATEAAVKKAAEAANKVVTDKEAAVKAAEDAVNKAVADKEAAEAEIARLAKEKAEAEEKAKVEAEARKKAEEETRQARENVPPPSPSTTLTVESISSSSPHSADNFGEGQKAGEKKMLTIKGVEYTFCWCPADSFMMGSPESEERRDSDETPYKVTLSRGFWMQETEVTQKMWKSVMGDNPSEFKGDNFPVENVSWNDSQDFIEKLNETSGIPSGYKASLPSEAQWEYACRAGSSTPFSFGSVLNGDKANCNGNFPYGTEREGKYLKKTTAVKSYNPNEWGLYDMHGNVCEWCLDRYGDYPAGSVTDPKGPDRGSDRVFRGGCWCSYAWFCRSANRNGYVPTYRSDYLGFRVALVPSK